jgi:hypothetical protein
MQSLTPAGQNIVNDIANRYNLTTDAVIHMMVAVNNGGGTMAQFSSPELGGSGQWMQGGMTMVGDMFNHGLKATVDNLCNELAASLANNQIFPVIPAGTPGSNQWWPIELGAPFSSGAQNNIRYAVFPQRLAIEQNGNVVVYDTLDHQIGGVSQQQGGDTSLSFSSQYGTISVNSLPIISGIAPPPPPQTNFAAAPGQANDYQPYPDTPAATNAPAEDVIHLLEQLGRLRDGGVLTQDEFDSKKRELMNRI